MAGDLKSQYGCVKAFSETDFTNDLKKITLPVMVMHGEDDQIVPIEMVICGDFQRNASIFWQDPPHSRTDPSGARSALSARLWAPARRWKPANGGPSCRVPRLPAPPLVREFSSADLMATAG